MTVGDHITQELEKKARNTVATRWKLMPRLIKASKALPEPFCDDFDEDAVLDDRAKRLEGRGGYLEWRTRLNPKAQAGSENEQTSKGVVVYIRDHAVPGHEWIEEDCGGLRLAEWEFRRGL